MDVTRVAGGVYNILVVVDSQWVNQIGDTWCRQDVIWDNFGPLFEPKIKHWHADLPKQSNPAVVICDFPFWPTDWNLTPKFPKSSVKIGSPHQIVANLNQIYPLKNWINSKWLSVRVSVRPSVCLSVCICIKFNIKKKTEIKINCSI